MSTASDIVAGLGGQENITDLEPCITRLRVEVVDQAKVDEEALRAAGAFGAPDASFRSSSARRRMPSPRRSPPCDSPSAGWRGSWLQHLHFENRSPSKSSAMTPGWDSGRLAFQVLDHCALPDARARFPRHTLRHLRPGALPDARARCLPSRTADFCWGRV